MPIIRRAIKKLRHDQKKTKVNAATRLSLRKLVKAARKSPTKKSLSTVFQALDKAAKIHVIHANKAARLKSRLSKLAAK
jgi:small subunit ribosomal protein S20